MEKQKYCLIFGRAKNKKIWNYLFLTKKRKGRRKLKIYILIVLKVSWKAASQNNYKARDEVNCHPGADMIVMGNI